MSQKTLPKAHEILSIVSTLEGELRELDRIGAGIAAIHVNAAIEQLRTNLKIVNDNCHAVFAPARPYLVPEPAIAKASHPEP